jgi:hypothetical protein
VASTTRTRALEETLSFVLVWQRQAQRFAERLRRVDFHLRALVDDQDVMRDLDADRHFAVLTLSNVWRGLTLTRRVTGDVEVDELLQRFDSEIPSAKSVRDLHIHLDAYIAGEGWDAELQKAFDEIDARHNRPATTYIVPANDRGGVSGPVSCVSVYVGPEIGIDLLSSRDIASELAKAAERVIERYW